MPNHKIKLLPIFQPFWHDDIQLFSQSSLQYILLICNFVYRHHSNHYKTDYLSIYHLGVFPFRTRAVVIRSRVPLINFPNVVQDWLAYIHTKARLEALLHLQHRKCLDPSNFVLHFVKRLFKPPRLSNNSYIRIEGLWLEIPDMISHLFKFPIKVIKVHTVEILLSVLTMQVDLSSSTSFYFNLSFTECSFACFPSRYFVQKGAETNLTAGDRCFAISKKYLATASRIGGHIKYVITYRDCSAIPLTLSRGVNQLTWSRGPRENCMTSSGCVRQQLI